MKVDRPYTARLCDATGRVAQRSRLVQGQQQLDLSAQPDGIYVLALYGEAGTFSAQRVVVQR